MQDIQITNKGIKMEHTISRLEKILNENGSIKEVFITVKLRLNANDTWEYGYWLTPAEIDSIVIDENNINEIVDRVAIIAEEAYNNSLNIVPDPTPILPFNVDNFLFSLMEAFTPLTDYMDILIFYPMIADFARANNFIGMNVFVQGLMSYSIMTQDQFNTLNTVLQLQGIDLNNL